MLFSIFMEPFFYGINRFK